MSEADLQATIIEYLLWHGYLVMRINGGAMMLEGRYIEFYYWQTVGRERSSAGASDVLALCPWGQWLVIECKAEGKNPTPAQVDFMQAVKERGGLAFVADNINDFLTWIEAQVKSNGQSSPGGDGD